MADPSSDPNAGTAADQSVATTETPAPISTDVNTAVSSTPGPNTGVEPKGAQPSGDPPSMLDAVKSALKPKADAAPASQTPDKQADGTEPPKAEETQSDEDKELTDDELKSLSARTQRRFRKLNSDVKTRDVLIGQLEPKAQEFDRLDQFVRSAGLSPTDVQGTLRIASQLRSDPHAAYEALLPIMQHLEAAIGNVLPPELAQRVQAGYLTEQDALAMSRAASHASFSRQQLEAERQQQQDWYYRQDRQQQLDNTVSSVESWEKQQATRDPDWHLKQADIRELVELEVSRKRLADPSWLPGNQEALKITQDAYTKVNDRLKRFVPKPQAMARDPSGGGASPGSQPQPKNMLDVVRMAASRGR